MITVQDVKNAYGLEANDQFLEIAVEAANSFVYSLDYVDVINVGLGYESHQEFVGQTKAGALMLAMRIYERRDSRSGVLTIGDSASYIARFDPDIARLLKIDAFQKPKVV